MECLSVVIMSQQHFKFTQTHTNKSVIKRSCSNGARAVGILITH